MMRVLPIAFATLAFLPLVPNAISLSAPNPPHPHPDRVVPESGDWFGLGTQTEWAVDGWDEVELCSEPAFVRVQWAPDQPAGDDGTGSLVLDTVPIGPTDIALNPPGPVSCWPMHLEYACTVADDFAVCPDSVSTEAVLFNLATGGFDDWANPSPAPCTDGVLGGTVCWGNDIVEVKGTLRQA